MGFSLDLPTHRRRYEISAFSTIVNGVHYGYTNGVFTADVLTDDAKQDIIDSNNTHPVELSPGLTVQPYKNGAVHYCAKDKPRSVYLDGFWSAVNDCIIGAGRYKMYTLRDRYLNWFRINNPEAFAVLYK